MKFKTDFKLFVTKMTYYADEHGDDRCHRDTLPIVVHAERDIASTINAMAADGWKLVSIGIEMKENADE